MRVGIVSFMHESNTFVPDHTPLSSFERERLLKGESIREQMAGMHHEVGGFFDGLASEGVEAIPVFAAWAMPSGIIEPEAANELTRKMLAAVAAVDPLDGWLVAPHGAAVAENANDFDGQWLQKFRTIVGWSVPVIGTLDLHANLSPLMVSSVEVWLAYRTNPHLDQHATGYEAARLLVRQLRGEVKPTTVAAFPPLVVNIESQATSESPCRELYELAEKIRHRPGVLAVSLLLGFPYADVPEMGAALTVTTDNDRTLATQYATELARWWWDHRELFNGKLTSPEEAVRLAARSPAPVCLLDMGDNIGGGGSADSTVLLHELISQGVGPTFAILHAPQVVSRCQQMGVGQSAWLAVGGTTDGRPVEGHFTVCGLFDGVFEESEARHGGLKRFDQGDTAVVQGENGLILMLTSLRTAPFSLHQLTSFGVDPSQFRVLITKGVHAPFAAYRTVCPTLIRVNTPGLTSANLKHFEYHHRRKPLYPFEHDTAWDPSTR